MANAPKPCKYSTAEGGGSAPPAPERGPHEHEPDHRGGRRHPDANDLTADLVARGERTPAEGVDARDELRPRLLDPGAPVGYRVARSAHAASAWSSRSSAKRRRARRSSLRTPSAERPMIFAASRSVSGSRPPIPKRSSITFFAFGSSRSSARRIDFSSSSTATSSRGSGSSAGRCEASSASPSY